MANPRSLVGALYVHWDVVEVLVRLSREFAVLTSEQVLSSIAKATGQDAEGQGAPAGQARRGLVEMSGPVT